jgi:hypothetical protein
LANIAQIFRQIILIYNIYFVLFSDKNLADRLASKNKWFTSPMSSLLICVLPFTLQFWNAGVSNWMAYLQWMVFLEYGVLPPKCRSFRSIHISSVLKLFSFKYYSIFFQILFNFLSYLLSIKHSFSKNHQKKIKLLVGHTKQWPMSLPTLKSTVKNPKLLVL